MRLLVDARVGWGHGIGRVVASTVPRVARLRPDWQLDVLVGPADLDRAAEAFGEVANLSTVTCDIRPFSPREQVALGRYATGYDLTWFTNYWVPLAWRGRFVATVHDVLHLLPDLLPASRINRALSRLTFAKVRREAEAVMFVSRFTEREFRAKVGHPAHGVAVPLGSDHLPAPERRPSRRKTLLVVAAPKRHKNFALLLDAWRAAAVGPDWVLTIVAPGEAMRTTVDLGKLAAGGRNVEVHRSVSNQALSDLFAASSIVLTPSLYEGFGLPLLEGLSAGALCVSSTAGALVEVGQGAFVQFVNGRDRAGWTAAIEQACALCDNGFDLAPLAEHNRRRAARYTWDRTATGVVEVIDRAIGTTSSARGQYRE